MKFNPIIPIWLMSIICVVLIALKRKGIFPYIRQIAIIALIFIVNLRIMIPGKTIPGEAKKLDAYVLFVVDDTISMLARDYNGDEERLTAVKKDCEYIVDELYGAKFSFISFNNTAQLLSPFTNDSEYAKSIVKSIYPLDDLYAKGTSMNVCRNMMINSLKSAKDKNDGKIVLFFISDGEVNNGDKIESFDKAKKYIDNGAVLGYGSKKGGKMYIKSYYDDELSVIKDNETFKDAISKIDEGNLKDMASDMGISYVNMNGGNKLDGILNNIKKNLQSTSEAVSTTGYTDIYYYFVIPIFLLLIYEFAAYRRRV